MQTLLYFVLCRLRESARISTSFTKYICLNENAQ